jgi:RHS repeat-associated protein
MTRTHAYSSYGGTVELSHFARIAFAGEVTERHTGWYMLGNRLYSPTLRRFLATDPESPFDEGNFNRYAYCSGDPVNRIDPTGNAWTDWLMAGLGLGLAILGTVFSVGAAAPALAAVGTAIGTAASGSLAAASIAPSAVATIAAATLDVVSLGASIGSVGSMATKDQKANSIFGWIGITAGVGAAAATVTAARLGGFGMARAAAADKFASRQSSISSTVSTSSTSTTAASSVSKASIRVKALVGASTAGGVSRAGLSTVNAGASGSTQRMPSNASLVTSNATASRPQLKRAFAATSAGGAKSISLYAGPPTSRKALQNPHARSDGASKRLSREDRGGAAQAAASAGVKVDAIDLTSLTKEQIRRRLSDDGMHVVVAAHGLVDQATLTSLNMPDTVSDSLLPVRAAP